MRSYTPGDKDDEESLKDLRAEPWMIELLKLNPEYVHWGPYEDYMFKPADDDPWHEERKRVGLPPCKYAPLEARILNKNWAEHQISIDSYNEVVHFYFSIERDSKRCEICKGTCYHPEGMWVSETFYPHMIETMAGRSPEEVKALMAKYPGFADHVHVVLQGKGWHTNITQDEVDALVKEGRLYDLTHTCEPGKGWQPKVPAVRPTAEEVNKWASSGMGHDAINRMILVETRLKRLGMPERCPHCEGTGHLYTSETARVMLTYWLLHPRKGCSRGVEIADIKQNDLPQVFAFLKHAAERSEQRFAKVVDYARRCS